MFKSSPAFALSASLVLSACATNRIPYNPANSQFVPDFAFVEISTGKFAELDSDEEILSLSETMKVAVFVKKDGEEVVIPCQGLPDRIATLNGFIKDPKLSVGTPRITAQRDEMVKANKACAMTSSQGPTI